MEPEGSLPRSQEPATCLYPEPDRSSPCLPFYFSKIYFNIILPYTPPSFKSSLSVRFPCMKLPLLHTCYMLWPSQSSWLDNQNDIWWRVQNIKLLVMQSSPHPCFLVPLGSIYSPRHHIFENPQPTLLPQYERPSFTTIQNNRQDCGSVYLNIYTLG